MSIEIAKLIRQNIGVRNEVEVLLAILLLHSYHVKAESVLTGNFIALREVIDLLMLIQTLI